MINYKLIEPHTLSGESSGMWLLLTPEGDIPQLPDGTLVGLFSSPPADWPPARVAQALLKVVEMARTDSQ